LSELRRKKRVIRAALPGRPGTLSPEDFLQRRASQPWLARLTHNLQLPQARGLEFGAAHNPTPLSEGHLVEYVDYCAQPDGAGEDWVVIDHVWDGAGKPGATFGPGQSYQFAIARHVAQYVPNLLGWFRGIFDLLEVGGVLNLSLPDHRFTFDCARRPSSIAEAVEALALDFARPSARQLFDHTYGARSIEPGRRWREDVSPASIPRLSGDIALNFAYDQCRDVLQSGRYVPCHCWVFSPLSFLSLMEEATRLALFPYVFNEFFITEPDGFEFFVSLRRDAETDPAALLSMQLDAIAYLRDVAERQIRVARRMAEA
jgi:hypothetical protein